MVKIDLEKPYTRYSYQKDQLAISGNPPKSIPITEIGQDWTGVISGFRREVDENCVLLGCYAASSGNFLPTFRDNISIPSSGFNKESKRIRNYHYSLRNASEEFRAHDRTFF